MGFRDVTKYIYYSREPMVGVLYGFINKKRWNELPPDLKKAVKKAAFDSALWCAERTQLEDTKYAHNIAENSKVKVLILPADVDNEMAAAVKRLFEKKYKEDPDVRKVIDSWKQFYGEEKWLQYRKFLQPTQ